jgi:CRP-like cAMP-binding protein
VVFHEGDPGDSLHRVTRGRFAARITTPLGDIATFAVHGPGEVFGRTGSKSAVSMRPRRPSTRPTPAPCPTSTRPAPPP